LGHPCKCQRVSRLGSVTARHSSSGRQPNFVALNRGCHLYSAWQPSRWALAHVSSFVFLHFILWQFVFDFFLTLATSIACNECKNLGMLGLRCWYFRYFILQTVRFVFVYIVHWQWRAGIKGATPPSVRSLVSEFKKGWGQALVRVSALCSL